MGLAKQKLSSNSGMFVCKWVGGSATLVVTKSMLGSISTKFFTKVRGGEISDEFVTGPNRLNRLKMILNHFKYLHNEILFLKTNNNKQKLVKSWNSELRLILFSW